MQRVESDAFTYPHRIQHCNPGRASVASFLVVFWMEMDTRLPRLPHLSGWYDSYTSPYRRQYRLPRHRCPFPVLHIHNISWISPYVCTYPGIRRIFLEMCTGNLSGLLKHNYSNPCRCSCNLMVKCDYICLEDICYQITGK
jgi:hypothetical protein